MKKILFIICIICATITTANAKNHYRDYIKHCKTGYQYVLITQPQKPKSPTQKKILKQRNKRENNFAKFKSKQKRFIKNNTRYYKK